MRFSSLGQNIGGKWADLAKAVEERRKRRTPVPTPAPLPADLDSDNDPDLDYNIMNAKKELYCYDAGRMRYGSLNESTPCEQMDVLICDASVCGHQMKVQQGTYSLNKIRRTSPRRWLYGVKGQGARLANCQLQWVIFRDKTNLIELDLAGRGGDPPHISVLSDGPYNQDLYHPAMGEWG
ncbi:hypothetical protein C8F04DRAFT_1255423 [Mycena alexandri]|uniref:Uncharacterized protein n=1 Tax=Mycena alexandri TaxID=1745969 RepID=A0AAD6T3M5_9AGAR|nr:hypothetical protein C8F04DRAFT_1255423 [Mycena alexandri]